MKSVFADTFHLLALLKADDTHHRRALELHRANRQGLEALRTEFCATVTAQVNELSSAVQLSEKRVMDFGTYLTRLEGRAEAMEQDYVAVRLRVIARLKEAYYDLQLAQQSAVIIERNRQLLVQSLVSVGYDTDVDGLRERIGADQATATATPFAAGLRVP